MTADSAPAALVSAGLVVTFGGTVAVNDVSLQAPSGRITGLIGPNGAGKTTTFNALCGFQRLNAGRVELDVHDITGHSAARRARLGIGRTFQRMELLRSATVRENIEVAAETAFVTPDPMSMLGLRRGGRAVREQVRALADDAMAATGLTAIADKLAGNASAGEGRLIEFARALARQSRILLLDEPSSGLDVAETMR